MTLYWVGTTIGRGLTRTVVLRTADAADHEAAAQLVQLGAAAAIGAGAADVHVKQERPTKREDGWIEVRASWVWR